MRARLSSLIPLAASFAAWLSSPDVLAILPDKVSHYIMLGGILVQAVTPALITNKPSSPLK